MIFNDKNLPKNLHHFIYWVRRFSVSLKITPTVRSNRILFLVQKVVSFSI